MISLEAIDLPNQGIGGKDIVASPGAQLAHELFSHSYETDQGTNDTLPGFFGAESRAINVENIYRKANNEDVRITHAPDEPW